MSKLNLQEHSHQRYNPLTGDWILVSPHRNKRPWLGQTERNVPQRQPGYDANCYLCPGNTRANKEKNPKYKNIFIFDNDFAALQSDVPPEPLEKGGLIKATGETGICRVICFSSRHDLSLSKMKASDIAKIAGVWAQQYRELGANPNINYVQIFENRGAMMGASNPHPHGQIWATRSVPNEPTKEQSALSNYLVSNGSCLLCDYRKLETSLKERIVCENQFFTALVPFWAIWPFELMLLPKHHGGALEKPSSKERQALGEILQRMTRGYDNLFQTPFPYSMGFHQRPTDGQKHLEWHWHAHFYPPLLRSATVRKFMVGYELLAAPQRDITPESAANLLRATL